MIAISVVFGAALAVLLVCVVFVFHKDYHAGFLGNIGLCLVALAALTRLAGILEQGGEAHVPPVGLLLWCGLALFLGRMALRFLWRARARGADWREVASIGMRCP